MSILRIKAVLLQDIYISLKSLEVIVDLPFFSIMTIICFGYVTKFFSQNSQSILPQYLLLGILLWEIMRVSQYSLTVGSYWNIWARNLTNIFIAPISTVEYMVAHMISAFIKSVVVFIMACIVARLVFGLDILTIGFTNLVIYFIALILFAWALGIFILGFVFRFGSRYAALGWGLIFLFQPLMGTFFPVKILPGFIQVISYLIPATYIFEAARNNLLNPIQDLSFILPAFILDIVYLVLACFAFHLMFHKSKDTGQFSRNEG